MKLLTALLISASLLSAPAMAKAKAINSASDASAVSVFLPALLVYGSLLTIDEGAGALVASVDKVGEVTTIVLKSASGAASASIELSGDVAQGMSLAAGTAVSVTATASGHMLIAAGKVLAFIPNAAGKALLHSSSHTAAGK